MFVEFSGQEYWSGLPFPSPGDLPVPGIEPRSPALQADSLLSEPPGKPSSATKEAIMQQVEKAHSLQRRPRAAKKKSMYYTHTHTHTHTHVKDLMPVCPFLYTIRNPDSMQSSSSLVLELQEGSYGNHNLMCPGKPGTWPQPKPVWRRWCLPSFCWWRLHCLMPPELFIFKSNCKCRLRW